MNNLLFATTNHLKISVVQATCQTAGIRLEPITIDIDEIQGEDPEYIISDKARRAFDHLARPVIVSDDTWSIPALNGFPGPYMKSINQWFTPDDFLRLMEGKTDRRIYLNQYLAFADKSGVTVFKHDIPGKIVTKASTTAAESACESVIAIDFDDGKTIAEAVNAGEEALRRRNENRPPDAWHAFCQWYINRIETRS